MKIFLLTTLTFHGLIHLLGFAKGFHLLTLPELPLTLSKPVSLAWLGVGLLFLFGGLGYLLEWRHWPKLLLVTVGLSTLLILSAWQEAKFGMLPNMLALGLALIGLYAEPIEPLVQAEIAVLRQQGNDKSLQPIGEAQLAQLPPPVQQWMRRSGIIGRAIVDAEVWQTAKMRMKPGQGTWYHATAHQYTHTLAPGFVWTVSMQMMPFLQIQGRDRYLNGRGEMRISLPLGIPLSQASGAQLDEGTLQRFLGELVWFPSLALSPHISWQAIDAHTAMASMHYKGVTGSGTFFFDDAGDFVQFTALRFMGDAPDAPRYEWVMAAEAYQAFAGIRVPTQLKATWTLPEGPWTWLELQVERISYQFVTDRQSVATH